MEEKVETTETDQETIEIDQVELTSDETFNELIKETVANGYVFVHENGRNIIKKAKITVYKMENEDG